MRLPLIAAGLLLAMLAQPAEPRVQATDASSPATPVTIQVHASQSTGPYKPIWNFFGADEPNYLYAPNGKKLLHELAALSPVPVYFRPHNLFTTGNGEGSLKWGSTNVYTERPDGTPVYNFTITDRIFDTLVAAHVRPLSRSASCLRRSPPIPSPTAILFPRATSSPAGPIRRNDEDQVVESRRRLCRASAPALRRPDRHLALGGLERARHSLLARHPRAIRPPLRPHRRRHSQGPAQAKIGGPEATGISDHSEPFLRQFLEHCAHG